MSAESLLRSDATERQPLPSTLSGEADWQLPAADDLDHSRITDRLQELIERGFRFAHPRNAEGTLVAIVGIRPHHGVIDIVQLYSEQDADAARIPGDEPDVLFPRNVLWRTNGTPLDVLDSVLGLEDPVLDNDKARCHASGCWVPTHPGRSAWLAVSA